MTDDPLLIADAALAGEPAWLVGGAVRDRLLGRPVADLDIVVQGDVAAAARRLRDAGDFYAFELSEAFGAWRVVARAGGRGPEWLEERWHADLMPLRGEDLHADLALRDFTINAMAEPLGGGEIVDPFGGAADLEARRVRIVGPRSLPDDPLRVMRLARFACELGFTFDAATAAAATEHAPGLTGVAAERVFVELRRIVLAPDAARGIALLDEVGALDVVLPELAALRGIEQTVYHHRDAYGHTLEVLERTAEVEEAVGGELRERVAAFLRQPLADEIDRGGALRFAALLHDVGKARTMTPNPKGGYGFPGHDTIGDGMVRDALTRLRAADKLRGYVAALTRHHLKPGFLVHARPLGGRALYSYLKAAEPVAADTVLLSIADRLATRGRKHDEAIASHLEVARELLGPALDWHEHGPPPPLVRGDDLADELGIALGPDLGRLLAEIAAAQYAGEIATREDAISFARGAARPPR